ncbi:Leucine-rich repeat [Sesbania bispinosa]|nr:Leucine-rich repeat [Sesbania bispinosa]
MGSSSSPITCFLFILIFCFSSVKVACGQCFQDEKLNLLQLKSNLTLSSIVSSKISLWNSSNDCCSWPGITCNSNGQVTALDLSTEFLSGKLDNSSTLFNLVHLQTLNLAFNLFSSIIPSNVGKLANLVTLNLSNSGFNGQIPFEISQLTRLRTLDLSSFHLPGEPCLTLENPNLTMIIQNMFELEELLLDGVMISTNGSEWSHSLTSMLPKLQVISMSNCDLTSPFPQSLMKLQSLSVIDLSQNNIVAPFPEFAGNFSKLISMRCRNCGLLGNVSEKIFKVTTLQTLDLSSNRLMQGSLPVFSSNSSLKTLILSGTNFGGQVPDSIGSLGLISKLDLSSCNFEGVLPNSMTNLTELVYLDLSNNNFVGSIPSFQGLKKLSILKLSHNYFTGSVHSNFFEGLASLVSIDMRNNLLNGSIPSSLLTIQGLQKLDLAFNRFSGQLDEIPNPSSSLLETVYLESNILEGPIPMSFYNLPNLKILSLSFNKFNGIVSVHDVQNLGNLTSLDLSHNHLTINVNSSGSTLPSFPSMISTLRLASCNMGLFPDLRNLTKLAFLDLSDNLIRGQVPSWIWSIVGNNFFHLNLSHNLLTDFEQPSPRGFTTYMTVLDLHSNMFQGQIPILPPLASYLDYSNNSFASPIPDNIGDCLSYATFFSISGNKFTGSIPESICSGTYLQVLDLSNNELSGTIPPCLTKMSPTLFVLNMGKNNLHGVIPETFPGNCSLRTLDLSENALEGEVPRTLAHCTTLEVLNLGGNQLNDHFPCWLNNFSNLRVLVLRYNKFSGSIDCPGFDNSWTNLQIIDLACNQFSSKLPSRYFSSWKAMMVDVSNSHSVLNQLQHKVFTFTDLYYQDRVMVTSKGLQWELVKILSNSIVIDFSNNMFQGQIPVELGHLQALYVLNMSHNAFTGEIPSSSGNLKQLESLDLSYNSLHGKIPVQLVALTFLSVLNLSFNELEGEIPRGNQFGTFSEESFLGNKALCGPPMTLKCTDAVATVESHLELGKRINSRFISSEVGFLFGLGIVIGSLMFWKKWRTWYYEKVADKIIFIFQDFSSA